jgi:hypothetical protein
MRAREGGQRGVEGSRDWDRRTDEYGDDVWLELFDIVVEVG